VADTLIAGTALERRAVLPTANVKHYRIIDGLRLRPFSP
jgi:predicted nucleic acid-binding protein